MIKPFVNGSITIGDGKQMQPSKVGDGDKYIPMVSVIAFLSPIFFVVTEGKDFSLKTRLGYGFGAE